MRLRGVNIFLQFYGFSVKDLIWMIKLYFLCREILKYDDVYTIISAHTVAAYAKYVDYILGVVFYPKPSSVSDVAGIQSVHASLN